MLIIHGGKVYTEDFHFAELDLLVEGSRIHGLSAPDKSRGDGLTSKVTDHDRIDAKGKYIIPGLIDIHIHGAMGVDTMDADLASLQRISLYLAGQGVTSFLPTTMTMPAEALEKVFRLSSDLPGAAMLGFNMEGPFIHVDKRGAQCADYVRHADTEEFREYLKFATIKIVTLAPEIEGAMDFIAAFAQDTVISLGHTTASYEIADEAIRKGALSVTHTFNAMPPFLHREPSVIGAAVKHGIYGEVICDGVHIHPAVVYCAYRLLGKEKMILVSDSMRAAGLDDGLYELGGQAVSVQGGVARTGDGSIAGSTGNLWSGLCHAVDYGIPLADAIRMCTYNPALLIGEAERKGRLLPGLDADFVIMDDQLCIESVYIGGRLFRL